MEDPGRTRPRLSLIVPAHDEEALLPRLLDSVDAARTRLADGDSAVEVIVADNASTDRTAGIARSRGCRVATVEQRSIAAARNGGAVIAHGEILAFTDADGAIHPDTFAVIARAMADRRTIGGATGVAMERWSPGIALTFALALPWIWLLRIDAGVVFCRREDFEAVGGYDEAYRYAEDVEFLFALRRLGKARGQHLVRPRGAKTVASARKFDQHGDWHYFTRMPRLAWRWLAGRNERDAYAESYWYGERRRSEPPPEA